MNYLAHLYLADRAGADLAGGVLGDFVRGPDLSRLPEAVAHSVRLHRRIDTLTDQHPVTLAAIARYPLGPRRYAPVILDVLADHLLATDWPRYSEEPFAAFCARSARALAQAGEWFALHGAQRPSAAGFRALLHSYRSTTGIDFALQRIARRLRRPGPMIEASRGWQAHAEALRPELPRLLAELGTAAGRFIEELRAAPG